MRPFPSELYVFYSYSVWEVSTFTANLKLSNIRTEHTNALDPASQVALADQDGKLGNDGKLRHRIAS